MKKHAAATAADPRTTLAAAIPSMDLLTCLDKIDDSTNGEPPRFIALAVAFIFAVVVKALRMALQNMPEWRGASSYDKQPNLRGCDRCVCTRCLHRKQQRTSRLLEDYVVRIDARGSGWNGTPRKMAAPRCLGIHEEREAVVAANLERANVAVQRTVIGHTEAQGVQYLDGLIFPVQHGAADQSCAGLPQQKPSRQVNYDDNSFLFRSRAMLRHAPAPLPRPAPSVGLAGLRGRVAMLWRLGRPPCAPADAADRRHHV